MPGAVPRLIFFPFKIGTQNADNTMGSIFNESEYLVLFLPIHPCSKWNENF
jgi:hypothetical protein